MTNTPSHKYLLFKFQFVILLLHKLLFLHSSTMMSQHNNSITTKPVTAVCVCVTGTCKYKYMTVQNEILKSKNHTVIRNVLIL